MQDEPFDIPDEVIDRHFESGAVDVEEPAEAGSPDEFAQDNLDYLGPDADDEDKGEEYAGAEDDFDDLEEGGSEESDDDLLDDDLESDLDDEPEDDAQSPILDKLTRQEIEEIKADPRLAKAHRLMHGRFTEAMQELRAREQGMQQQASEVQDFLAEIRTDEGAIALMQTYAMSNPALLSRAFRETFKEQPDQAQFLVDLALDDPEVLREALDQVEGLHADPDRLETRRERQKLARERAEIERDKANRQRHYASQRSQEVRSWMEGYAQRADIPPEEQPVLEQRIIEKIRENRAQSGKGDITKDEVRRLTIELRNEIRTREDRVRARIAQEERKRRNQRRQQRARSGNSRPRPPSSGGAPSPRNAGLRTPEGKDPLDHALDTAFDRLTS